MSRENLKPSGFYWVIIAVTEGRDHLFGSHVEWQPARYIGQSGDADARLVWEVLGENREDYHHRVDVVDYGPEIVRPERGCL